MWSAPSNGGSQITSYIISFKNSDGTTYSTTSFCDGSDPAVVSSRSCSVSSSKFTQAPFFLPWGSSIYAQVIAINIRGQSEASDDGNGAVILTVPDKPINLRNDATVTSGSSIGLLWDEGAANGGSPVLDYKISFTTGSNAYVTLDSGIFTTEYTAIDLIAGQTYKFKV